jgi:hypothetical protein
MSVGVAGMTIAIQQGFYSVEVEMPTTLKGYCGS